MIQIDMEMPKGCGECTFRTNCEACEGYDDFCVLTPENELPRYKGGDGYLHVSVERPEWCPLKEAP